MSAEIAPLGFDIDTSALVQGAKAADTLATALTGVANAADKVDQKAPEAAAEVKKVAEAEKQAALSAEEFSKAVVHAVTAMTKEQEAAKKAADELKKKEEADRKAALAAKKAAEEEAMRATVLGRLAVSMRNMQGSAANSNQHVESFTSHLTNLSQTLQAGGGGLQGNLSGAAGLLGRFAHTLGPIGGVVAGLTGGVLAMGGAYVGLNAVLGAVQDRFALLEGRLKNVYGSSSVAKQMFGEITVLANKNAVAIDQTAESFLRLARNNEAIGLTRKQMVDLTDAVQMLGRVSGASTGELASGMMQFSQALASGRLNGDELRSIMENMPALAKAIATGMGVTVGQIRAMGAEGQLTGDKITKALLEQLPKIKAEFEGLPVTTEQSFTRVGNAWDTMLATMGQKLNSSKLMQYFAGGVEGVINVINNAIRDETPQEARARIIGGTKSTLNFPVAQYGQKQADAMMYDLMEQERFKGMLNRTANDKEARDGLRAPYNAAQRIFDEVDPARKKVGEITSNMQALTTVYQRWRDRPDLFSEEEVKRIERIPGYLEALKKQLNDALPPLEKFNRETINQRNDALKYGFGTDIGADIRRLTGTSDSAGNAVSEGRATSSVIFQRTTALQAQTEALKVQAEAERKRTEAIGTGAAAEREAEAAAKAHAAQVEKFGTLINADILKGTAEYRDALLAVAQAQDAAAGKQALLNAQIDLTAQKAAAGAVGLGSGAMAFAERSARRAGELAMAKPEDIASLQTKYAAEDQGRSNSEASQFRKLRIDTAMQRRLAGGMSPAAARQAQQEQEARQFSEGFSPDQQALAYQTKIAELRAKDAATIRQQLDEKEQAADLTRQEIELTAKGGLAAQVAIARARELNAIRAAGLMLTDEKVAKRLQLAEQAVLDADALSKAQRTANAYVRMWEDAGQAITSGLEGQFSKLLDGEKLKMQDFLQSITKDVAMAVIRAQITSPIANAFSDMGNGGGGKAAGGLAMILKNLLSSMLGIFGGGRGGIYGSGGVFAGGYNVTAFGGGGLLSSPTLFPMARGAGLAGEAGAEAILPLKRGPDGKLGVGGGQRSESGTQVIVNDMRSGGQQVESQEDRGPDGKRLIRLTIRDEVKGQMKNGSYDPEMRSQYGASRQLARR